MKKTLFASLLIAAALGASSAYAGTTVSGAIVVSDRHNHASVFFQPAPVYYGHPAHAYYARPVAAPVYYAPRHHGHHYHGHRHHQHHGHHRGHGHGHGHGNSHHRH